LFSAAAFSVSRVRTDGAQRVLLCHPGRRSFPFSFAGDGRNRFVMLMTPAVAFGITAEAMMAILAGHDTTSSA
jgi:hypothetical protein